MRLAVFTNQFPAPISTFFARDMRALIECGIELDIFALYPLEPAHWALVPALLDATVLPRDHVHHCSRAELLRNAAPAPLRRWAPFARDAVDFLAGAIQYGATPVAKTAYASACAWTWSRRFPEPRYDHVLAYWGNYAATAAYHFHRLTHPHVPFSMFARARVDLYRHPVRLGRKFLYADNVFLVCEYNRTYIARRFPEVAARIAPKLQVHYSGLPLEEIRFVPGGRPERTIVAVGRLEPLKGFDVLIRAVGLLAARGLAVRLELIGKGEQEADLRSLVRQLGLTAQVTFQGLVPPDAAIAAMGRATILVHPPVRRDAMPNVLKEALAVGTPAIASDLAGAPEILDGGRSGMLVPPGDVGRLAGAIERLLGDADLRREYAEAGRRHVESRFDMWRNGAALAEQLSATRRGAMLEPAHAG